MPPLVSIIIPTYNYAHFLPLAIDSALKQLHSNCEIIVIDDGSTDNTQNVLASYGNRIIAIKQENAGLSSARNIGLSLASGKYIQLLDADDELGVDAISEGIKVLESNPEKSGCVCNNFNFTFKPNNVKKIIELLNI